MHILFFSLNKGKKEKTNIKDWNYKCKPDIQRAQSDYDRNMYNSNNRFAESILNNKINQKRIYYVSKILL